MSQQQHHHPYTDFAQSVREQASPEAHLAPWMPLEVMIELWAAFGAEAQTYATLQATAEAFSALAFERSALTLYQREARISATFSVTYPPPASSTRSVPLAHAEQSALPDLEQARQHWREASHHLDSASRETCDADERRALSELIGETLLQQTRVATLVACLSDEQEHTFRRLVGLDVEKDAPTNTKAVS